MTQVTSWWFHLGDDEPPTAQQKKAPIYSEEETIWYWRCDVGICRQFSLLWWKYYLQVTNHFSKKESWRTQNHDFKISCLAHVQCLSWTSSSRLETVSEKVSKTSSESGFCRHYPGLARTVKMQVDMWEFLYDAIILRSHLYHIFDILSDSIDLDVCSSYNINL